MQLDGESDLCIIGSGPAGVILALEYAKRNPSKKVILVEYGTRSETARNSLDDSIKIHNPVNHHDPYECTNKGFGGTSRTWGGRCVMYDEIDFMDRPVLNGTCTWDLDLFNVIKKYIGTSAYYFECGDPIFDLSEMPKFGDLPFVENFVEGTVTTTSIERWSMPTRFNKRYLKELISHKNIILLEGYEARDFVLDPMNEKVVSLLIRSISDRSTKTLLAAKYVIAAGAQESTRILLRNLNLFHRIGGAPYALGKFYQGHVSGKIASVKFSGDPKRTNYSFLRDEKGVYLRRRFQFSKEFLLGSNLLNAAIWLDNPLYHDPKHRNGTMSLIYLAMIFPPLRKLLAPPAIARSVTGERKSGIIPHLWNVIMDFPSSFSTPAIMFIKRYLKRRKLPGIFLYSPSNYYALHYHAEQIPCAANRMELGPDGETLSINYTLSEGDIHSVIRLHEAMDEWLQRNNCGKLDYWYESDQLPEIIRKNSKDGIHQCGTTRIADLPEKGVVDRDLKLFGPDNVYVCSSSVFPTSGQANPTFLLGAFAVRLADHLSK